MKSRVAIGVDIGGTNTKLAIVTQDGHARGARSFKTQNFSDFSSYLDELVKQINELIEFKKTTSVAHIPIAGIGIGAPNANWNTGCIESPVNLNWGTVNLSHELETKLGFPVELDNDANTAALGEALFGAAKDVKDFILVTLGTGVGTGVYSEGMIIRSKNGKAGEGGHILIERNGRQCGCGGIGHLEAYASNSGVQKTALEIMGEPLKAREVSELAQKKDAKAAEVIEVTAEWLGLGLSSMASVLNPSLFVLGGGVSQISDDFHKRVEHWLNHHVFKPLRQEARVVKSQMNQEHGSILGAAALVLEKNS